MLRHFLLTVGDPARARRQLGRLVSGDEADAPQITTAEDWHVGFGPGPGDDPARAPRHPPDYCLNVGITWPGLVALGIAGARSNARVHLIRRLRRRSRGTSESGRRYGSERSSELDRWLRRRGRPRPGDAPRHQPGVDDEPQRPIECLVHRGRRLPRDLAQGRDGVDGDAGWRTRADGQGPFRLRRRHQHAHHPWRPGAVSAGSPAALRAMAVRLAGRRCELLGA